MSIFDGEKLISFAEVRELNLISSRVPGCEISRQTWDSYAKKGCRGVVLRTVVTPAGRRTKVSWIEEFIKELTAKADGRTPEQPAKPDKETRLQAARARIKASV